MREIPLTKGYIALVDDEDFERFGALRWYANITCSAPLKVYARRDTWNGGARERIYLHRAILGEGTDCDHRDGNTLDCRRHNLRPATDAQNMANSNQQPGKHGFRGVGQQRSGRYYARLGHDNQHVGTFDSAEEAARARDQAALLRYGEFARLNFPLI